ncbi:MAG: 16S rRNA (guanine(527)-N(7))-methyltransferase RsmG [Gammaproteobacteria bacterium]
MKPFEKLLTTNQLERFSTNIPKFVQYLEDLNKWNKTYNLTAITNPNEQMTKHIVDSLMVGHLLHGDHILDVGTGPGLPGIPLAICYPNKTFTLLDSNRKKTAFLTHIKQILGLNNVQIIHHRVESFSPSIRFDSIVSRAFSNLSDMLKKTEHLIAKQGRFIALKGVMPREELADIPDRFEVTTIKKLQICGLEGERHVVILTLKGC